MAEVLLFHHAHGLTPGMVAFADSLRAAGHTVHAPDLFEGRTFDDLEGGVGYAREVGFDAMIGRGMTAAEGLPPGLAYIGYSLGVMPAQALAQTRPGATGAVLIASCVPPAEFGTDWPDGVPVQVHGSEGDALFADEGDLDAARALVAEVKDGELFLYPGEAHVFADTSLPTYDPAAAALLTERVLAFLDRTA